MDYKEHHRLNQEFLERFPLEKLKDMTIEQYTNLNRSDSFCYWLEIKTRILGSISGNPSFKFGIYQYNTRPNDNRARMSDGKYAWNSFFGKTARKAFENVKKAVVKAAESGFAGDLDAIESIELAPMIKWKIAFMYSNESIIPYYSLDRLRVIGERMGMGNTQDASIADIQKFLIKNRKGRDIHEYGRLLNDIWKESDSTPERTESSDEGDKTMQATNVDKYIRLLKANKNLILTGAPGTGKTYLAKAIAKEMKAECELVQFHPSYDYTDFVEGLRPIQENAGEVGFERKDGVFKEFCARALKNLQDSKKTIQALQQESSVRDLLEDFIEESLEENTKFETSGTKNSFYIIDNKEKSIIVKVPANEKTSEVALPKSDLTTLIENDVPIKGGKDIQTYFHRKYRTQQDSYIYVFYNILKKRKSVHLKNVTVDLIPEKKFVFIIDEINRGEISKIFGELFFSIDPGYRGVAGRVKTQYQNLIEEGDVFKEGFYVPENVYIIGTMNDIDRSVESMDFAMRRRFAWIEVTAEESMKMLDGTPFEDEAKKRMESLNNAILKVRGLGEAYQIGAAYFKKIEQYNGDFQKLWDYHLKGLLYEYLRGNMNAKEQLDELKKAYDNETPIDEASI